MDILIPHEKLIAKIQSWAGQSREAFQVAHRFKQLLPETLKVKKRQFSGLGRMARAERQALCDAEYVEALEQCGRLRRQALEQRVQYETHLMLIHARQSLRALHALRKTSLHNPKSSGKLTESK